MTFTKNTLILSVFLMVSGAFASELATSNSNNQTESKIRSCSSYRDFKLAPRGTVCETSKGGQFKRARDGIKDVESGLVIMDGIKTFLDYDMATDYCEQKGQRLLTGWSELMNGDDEALFPNHDSEMVALEKRGFREVFAGAMVYQWFWSSTVHINPEYAYGIDASNGNVSSHFRDGYGVNASVICVVDARAN